MRGLVNFLQSREKKEGGGFSASPRLPATIEDSYCALRIVSFLNDRHYPGTKTGPFRKRHINYLSHSFPIGTVKGAKNLFQALWCLDFCKYDIGYFEPFYKAGSPLKLKGISLEDLYYLHKLANLLHSNNISVPFAIEMQPDILHAAVTVEDKWRALYITFFNGGKARDRRQLRQLSEWIIECQNSDGGFGFSPGTTSYIENCHYALWALKLLGTALDSKQRRAVQEFALACRTRSGGFSRRPDASPFMDATYHAVAVMLVSRLEQD